jgi:hypothetical protein
VVVKDDCGFRDQREADTYYGRCPDCGGEKGRCWCTVGPPEEPIPFLDSDGKPLGFGPCGQCGQRLPENYREYCPACGHYYTPF